MSTVHSSHQPLGHSVNFHSPCFVYLDRLVRAHHHSTSLQTQLHCGKFFSSANRALNILNSTFRPAFCDSQLLNKLQKYNSGFIRSQVSILIDHYQSVLDDALSHLISLPLAALIQTLPHVLKSVQNSTKLSLSSRQFAHLVLNQLKLSSTQSFSQTQTATDIQPPTGASSSSSIPRLMDLKVFPTQRHLLHLSFLDTTQPKPRRFSSSKQTKPINSTIRTKPVVHSTSPPNSPLNTSLIGDVSFSCPVSSPISPVASTKPTPAVHADPVPEPSSKSTSLANTPPRPITSPNNSSPVPNCAAPSSSRPKSPSISTPPNPSNNPTTEPSNTPEPSSYFLRTNSNVTSFLRQGHSTTSWSLPPLKKDTILVGDSNLARLSYIPSHWHAYSYSGANIDHLHSIFSKYAHPNYQPKNIILSVGINNRNQNPSASSVPSLKKLLSKTALTFPQAKVYMATINFSPKLTKNQQLNLQALNSAINSSPHCTAIPPLDSRLFLTGPDNIHWSRSTALAFRTHWVQHLNL